MRTSRSSWMSSPPPSELRWSPRSATAIFGVQGNRGALGSSGIWRRKWGKVATRLSSFYSAVLGRPFSDECLHHVAQLFIVVVNNAQRFGCLSADAIGQLEAAVEIPVFAKMLNDGSSYPNGYSRLICRLARRRRFRSMLVFASVRNAIRNKHVA